MCCYLNVHFQGQRVNATSHPDINTPSSGKRKVHFGGKKSQAVDIILSQKYLVISSNAISLNNKI